MEFEELSAVESTDEEKKRRQLEVEVMNLRKVLIGEEAVNKALNWAIHGPLFSRPRFSSSLPPRVQVVIEELIAIEAEISKLERRVEELKLSLHKVREQNEEWELQQQKWRLSQHNLLISVNRVSRSLNLDQPIKERTVFSSTTATDIQTISSTTSREEKVERCWRKTRRKRNQIQIQKETMIGEPNDVSEELVKCLISIYLDLNQVPIEEEKSESLLPSNRCMAKSSFSSKSTYQTLSFTHNTSNLDPYNISSGFEGSCRDIGAYNNFIQITRASLDLARLSDLSPAIRKLRVLMQKLSNVELTLLTYKQKLAFWINIYNASIMHAFLERGFPSTHEKLFALINKADEVNVGGIVFNAREIEHFILRPPSESKLAKNEKEVFLRRVYGLVYPEPNVIFALCRGSWSSPALRVYTPDGIVNELRKAKVEYLEASVGVTRSKKKIVWPKLLDWHMRDFADDVESLLEWIYSQLPSFSSLKTSIMNSRKNHMINYVTYKILLIQPHQSEFRYLLPI